MSRFDPELNLLDLCMCELGRNVPKPHGHGFGCYKVRFQSCKGRGNAVFSSKKAPKPVLHGISTRKLQRSTFWIAPRDSASLNYPDMYFSSHLNFPSRRSVHIYQEGHSLPSLKKESVIYIFVTEL